MIARDILINNAYKSVSWLVNREHFGFYVPEANILEVTTSTSNNRVYLINRDQDDLLFVQNLVLSGFEPKTVERASSSVTTVEASFKELVTFDQIPLMSKLVQDFIDFPIIKLKVNDEWLHSIVYGDVVVSYVWDTREIVSIIKQDKPLIWQEDFDFVNDDMNTPIHMTLGTKTNLDEEELAFKLHFSNPQTCLTFN